MPFRLSLLFAFAILFLCFNLAAADGHPPLQHRAASSSQLDTITSVSASSSSPPASSVSNTKSEESATPPTTTTRSSSTTDKPTSVSSTSSSTTYISSSQLPSAATSSINGDESTSVSVFNATLTPDELPIPPEITPGFGVAGVLLMLSGTVYALIGIKNRWLHIFLSAAYLSGLGIAVLILYVMTPPISNAIQGAYVVAITMTGLVLGGAALLVTEMTEGLGCIFGGFCLAMWLLVLKPGGLLTATGPVTVFIVCFILASFATSFSRFTRPYGLIGSTSFGGATVVVLGIDCFTTAGLKEFWAYIWDLNQNLFPLGATTYPLTRGIKVEIAAIVIIFLAGLISQSKLWKLIKKRRERRAIERLHEERHLGQEEEKVGRRIEHANACRVYWEGAYGARNQAPSADSGIGDMTSSKEVVRSATASTGNLGDEHIEMDTISPAPEMTGAGIIMDPKAQGVVTVRVIADDEPSKELGGNGDPIGSTEERSSHISNCLSIPKSHKGSTRDEIREMGADGEAVAAESTTNSMRTSTSGAPEVIPLPFTVVESEGDDRSSVATFADDDNVNRWSKRFSQGSELLRNLSQRSKLRQHRISGPLSLSTEELVVPHGVEDDRSSVAATVDDMTDDDSRSLPEVSPEQSPTEDKSNQDISSHSAMVETTIQPAAKELSPTEIMKRLSGSTTELNAQATHPVLMKAQSNAAAEVQTVKEEDQESDAIPQSVTIVAEPQPTALTKEALPPAVSRVVSSYRTNEWAKHLSNADAPEVEDLKLAHYPTEADANAEEAPALVNVEELQQTPENAQIRPASRSTSQISSHHLPQQMFRINSYQSLSLKPETTAPFPHVAVSGSASQESLQKPQQSHPMRSYRNNSTPNIGQTVVESPIEDSSYAFPSPPTSTLMGKRDNIIRNKSSFGFNSLATTPEAVSRLTSVARFARKNEPRPDDDNISLSERRSIIRQSSMVTPTPPLPLNTPFDSHQPRRQSSTPVNGPARDMQLAQWRASVQQDLQARTQPKKSMDKSRSALLQERMLAERQREMEQTRRGMRDSVFDERMRKGDMLEAHREALKRMQMEANKHI